MAIYIPNSQSQSMKTTPILSQINPGKLYKEENKKKPQTTHYEYILTILGLFWSQMNSLLSSHINGYSFLATQNPQYSNNVAFLSTPNPIAMKNRFENLSNLQSFSSVGPYTKHFNLSTFKRELWRSENTKPSTRCIWALFTQKNTYLVLCHTLNKCNKFDLVSLHCK